MNKPKLRSDIGPLRSKIKTNKKLITAAIFEQERKIPPILRQLFIIFRIQKAKGKQRTQKEEENNRSNVDGTACKNEK